MCVFYHQKEEEKAGDTPDCRSQDNHGSPETVSKSSLTLSAIKKILEAVGGSLSITEHHDLKDEAHSIHVIALSIPCRQYTHALGLGTMDDDRDDGGVLFNGWGNNATNARDATKTSRQMIDFGMDTPSDSLCERTMEVCDIFGVKVKRLQELTVNVNLNLYRVIFACSEVRCSELRDLGYKGKLVLVSTRSGTNRLQADLNLEVPYNILQFPYCLDDLDQFFQSMSQHYTLSTHPKKLTTIDRLEFLLQPHEHIPIVLWTKEVLRFLISLQLPRMPTDLSELFEPSTSTAMMSEKYPPTSAYTPIAATGAPEDADFEYLVNNKITVSNVAHESVRIADNHVDESLYPDLSFSMLGKYTSDFVLSGSFCY